MTVREIDLTPRRLPGWLERFRTEHEAVWSLAGGALELAGADGASARLRGWFPLAHDPPGAPHEPVVGPVPDRLTTDLARAPEHLGLVLVRRGGYAIGLARAGELLAHKTGTRYVQGRTAAGGWSQQRFARRRENQADDLVRAAADHARRILGPVLTTEAADTGLVLGGDRALLERLLTARGDLAPLRTLPRREYPDVTNPRYDVLTRTLTRALSVPVRITHP